LEGNVTPNPKEKMNNKKKKNKKKRKGEEEGRRRNGGRRFNQIHPSIHPSHRLSHARFPGWIGFDWTGLVIRGHRTSDIGASPGAMAPAAMECTKCWREKKKSRE
jgi:hypothetical protein